MKAILVATADLDFHTIAHNYRASFSPHIFFYMKKIDKKGFMYAEKYCVG